MNIKYRKKFLKELAKVPSKIRSNIEKYIFEELPKFDSHTQNMKIEKMKGYTNYYKIRFGDYRVGVQIAGDEIIIE